MTTSRGRRLLWVLIGAAVLVAVVAVAGPYVYIHFIEGPAPAKLELPRRRRRRPPPSTSAGLATASSPLSPAPGTSAPAHSPAIGCRRCCWARTRPRSAARAKIWGSLTIVGSTVTKGTFTVDMASVVSDQSQRNAHFDGPIMDVSQYPTATLTLSSPIDLGAIAADGVVEHYDATGALVMHRVTKTVTFTVSAERAGTRSTPWRTS